MKILVTGGTGNVGSQVVRELLAAGAEPLVLTRDAGRAKLPPGATAVEGSLLDAATARRVFRGVDGVFLLLPLTQTEAHEALMAISGMRLAGVPRIVYLSVHHADLAPWLPHFGAKIAAEAAIRRSGIPFTILRPNHFFQNDYWMKDAILAGVYPQPIGSAGLSRVDVRDIAEAAAIALTTDEHDDECYDLVGPDLLGGEAVAREWSRALGRPVRYGGDDLDAWEGAALQMLPDWLAFDLRLMFEHFQKEGLEGSAESIARQTQLLGHPPRSFESFAGETAAAWRAEAGGTSTAGAAGSGS